MYKFTVKNVDEIELLMMHNRRYCAEIAHGVSSRNRIGIIERAEQLGKNLPYEFSNHFLIILLRSISLSKSQNVFIYIIILTRV